MWNEPTEGELHRLPPLYTTENTPAKDTVIHMHFFLAGCDWYVAEYGPEERVFFGYVILNDDFQNAEWGYTSSDELQALRTSQGTEVDRDLNWRAREASEVERIVASGGI